MTYSDIFSIKY